MRDNRCKLFAFGRIKNDDKLIQVEGVKSLSEAELRQACRDRGLLGLLSVEEMRQQVNHKCFSGIYDVGNFYEQETGLPSFRSQNHYLPIAAIFRTFIF